jgi:hypothetical protein
MSMQMGRGDVTRGAREGGPFTPVPLPADSTADPIDRIGAVVACLKDMNDLSLHPFESCSLWSTVSCVPHLHD